MRLAFVFVLSALLGCSSADLAPDAGDESVDAGDVDLDAGDDASDAGDETPDAGPVSSVPGQCDDTSDCATGQCNVAAPGGICLGCGDDGDCVVDGSGATFTCSDFGSCNQDCGRDADCPGGLRCHVSGVCVVRRCDVDPCPAPYVCNAGLCARPPCDASCARCAGDHCIVE